LTCWLASRDEAAELVLDYEELLEAAGVFYWLRASRMDTRLARSPQQPPTILPPKSICYFRGRRL
jgi:hypothetical protein